MRDTIVDIIIAILSIASSSLGASSFYKHWQSKTKFKQLETKTLAENKNLKKQLEKLELKCIKLETKIEIMTFESQSEVNNNQVEKEYI